MGIMDPDVDVVLEYYRHLLPDFTVKHARVYKYLWRVEPASPETIMLETDTPKTTLYYILKDLINAGLVNRTNFKPVCFYASSPVKSYSSHLKKTLTKLEKGADRIAQLLENSSGQSGEMYLVKKDGGQQKLILKQNRETIDDIAQLSQIKQALEQQIKQVEKQKLKEYAVYK